MEPKKNKGGRLTAAEEAKKGITDILLLMEKMAECGICSVIATLPNKSVVQLQATHESLAAVQWKRSNTEAPLTDKPKQGYNKWEQTNLPDIKEEILPSLMEDLDRLQLENPAEFERMVTDDKFIDAIEKQLHQES